MPLINSFEDSVPSSLKRLICPQDLRCQLSPLSRGRSRAQHGPLCHVTFLRAQYPGRPDHGGLHRERRAQAPHGQVHRRIRSCVWLSDGGRALDTGPDHPGGGSIPLHNNRRSGNLRHWMELAGLCLEYSASRHDLAQKQRYDIRFIDLCNMHVAKSVQNSRGEKYPKILRPRKTKHQILLHSWWGLC